ncbi:MAG: hypothetical protein U0235_18300 [Polyangiaceae bacterium]
MKQGALASAERQRLPLGSVLRGPSARLTSGLAAKMNVLRGLDVPFYLGIAGLAVTSELLRATTERRRRSRLMAGVSDVDHRSAHGLLAELLRRADEHP